jgi:hypothetical protein
VLALGKVWVNGRLVADPPPAAYALREGDALPSGIDPASVRLAELRLVAMAAAIARGPSKAEAVASGHAAVAAVEGPAAGPRRWRGPAPVPRRQAATLLPVTAASTVPLGRAALARAGVHPKSFRESSRKSRLGRTTAAITI